MTAVLPTRLPVPITATEGMSNGSKRGGSKRKSAPTYASPSARAREAQRRRSAGPSTGSSERSTTTEAPLEPVDERHTVVELVAAQLLAASDEDRPHELVRERRERVAHDGRVMLAVDERHRTRHRRVVTSRSMRPVYFSYSPVARSNWMISSWPWKGYRRQIETCVPSTSTTL